MNAGELEIILEDNKDAGPEKYKLKNIVTHTEPMVLHGNGRSKATLNYLSNYIPNSWNSIEGCRKCKQNLLSLNDHTVWPLVYVALFVEINTPFFEEQLNKLYNLEYPKQRIHLFIHNSVSQ